MQDGVALLSVRPEYVRLIREGVKRVEFRRRPFTRRLTHIVIYESGAAGGGRLPGGGGGAGGAGGAVAAVWGCGGH